MFDLLGVKVAENGHFGGCRLTRGQPEECELDLRIKSAGLLLDDTLCESGGALEEALVIEEEERLERCVSGETARLANFTTAGIQREQTGWRRGPFAVGVETAAVESLASVRFVFAPRCPGFRPHSGGLPRFDAGATHALY